MKFICPEIPEEGYIEAENIEEAKEFLCCQTCKDDGEIDNMECEPVKVPNSKCKIEE